MKKSIFTAVLAIVLTFGFAGAIIAQDETFKDVNVAYSFGLPDAKWKLTVKPSATSPNVEYVFGDRIEGHLEVRRIGAEKNALLTDIVRDEEQKLQFLPGYIAGKEENFNGKLRGLIFNYEFVRAGKPMSGRFYFLRSGDASVYVLRFTGRKDNLRAIQNQTDSIARTFAVKP